MRTAAAGLILALAACAPAPRAAPPPAYAPDAGGIAILGTGQRIDFGRAEAGAIAAVTRLQGQAPDDRVACPSGATAVRWADGLSLHVADGAFLGWAAPDGTTAGMPCA